MGKMINDQNFPMKVLLCLAYGFVLLAMIVLLVNERRREPQPFTLSHSFTMNDQGKQVLRFRGEMLHHDLKGVLTDNLVNDNAKLWQLLADNLSKTLDVTDKIALASIRNNKLVSISLDNENNPQVLGSLELQDAAIKVKIVGERALVGMQRNAGLDLIDLHDPKALKLIAHYPQPGLITSMAVDHETIYYSDMFQGLGRIDLSAENPTPEQLVALDSPWRMALQGSKLAVGTTNREVVLFDITRDGQLIEVDRWNFSKTVNGVAFTEKTLVIALADGSLQVYDLASWPNLVRVADLTLPGNPLLLKRIPGREVVATSLTVSGVALIDLTSPSNPRLCGRLALPQTFYDMYFQDGRLYGATLRGVQMYALDEITNDDNSKPTLEVTVDKDEYDLYTWNGHVYGYYKQALVDLGMSAEASSGSSGRFLAITEKGSLDLYEQLEEGQLFRVTSLHFEDGVANAKFRGEHLYIVNRNGLQVFSVDQPELPVLLGRLASSDLTGSFAISREGYLLASIVQGGLDVIDIREPARPIRVARLLFPHYLPKNVNKAQFMLVYGQQAYISEGGGGVYVVDLSNPTSPALQQIIETKNYAKNMATYDGLLLVSDQIEGVFMIDIEDPDHAHAIGSWPTPQKVEQIAVMSDGLVISSRPGGTMKLPLPQRLRNLQIVNREEGRAEADRIASGQYVFFYDDETTAKVKVDVQ